MNVIVCCVLAAAAAAVGAGDPVQADDWLVSWTGQQPTLTSGTLGGVPTITLANGLISRKFVIPTTVPSAETSHPPPPPLAAGSSPAPPSRPVGPGCSNPGGELVKEPDGSMYPFYGLPCVVQSDCGECSREGVCVCCKVIHNATSETSCCTKGTHCPTPPAPPKALGFATVMLTREGHSGTQSDTGAQLLRTSSPEALITLDNASYCVGGLVGQTDFAFLNTTLLSSWNRDPTAFVYAAHRTGQPKPRFEWTPGVRSSDATASWPPQGLTLEIDFTPPVGSDIPAAHKDIVRPPVHFSRMHVSSLSLSHTHSHSLSLACSLALVFLFFLIGSHTSAPVPHTVVHSLTVLLNDSSRLFTPIPESPTTTLKHRK